GIAEVLKQGLHGSLLAVLELGYGLIKLRLGEGAFDPENLGQVVPAAQVTHDSLRLPASCVSEIFSPTHGRTHTYQHTAARETIRSSTPAVLL
ncbi:MAG TPA: hypothetical protein VM715_22840, partial [Candidatus Acidoferrum sp.]|nr:hypothetical protein [Candidatus Acidoferrum sp.]